MLIVDNGKRQIMEGIELPNQGRIRMLGEMENYKYLAVDAIKKTEIKEKISMHQMN